MIGQKIYNWTAGLALCAILSTSHLLGPDDITAAQDQAALIAELRNSAAGSARREAAAQRLCAEQRGPNSEARWTAEGHLVCTLRRGVKPMQLASGGVL